ncbi:MAG: fumarylacetoacetate hydrolase family protein [Chthoniobacterales bacterium]|nr:fumarylacetoacetate hydrolase family protein [Chthoniobacterales bacterium]
MPCPISLRTASRHEVYEIFGLELGDAPVTKPVIFLKPPSVLTKCPHWRETIQVSLPDEETHYECELVLQLNRGGYKMTLEEAESAIGAYTIGLDMTLREVQGLLKKRGHPWTISKVFPSACIIGPWIEAAESDFLDTPFMFKLDGIEKQRSCGRKMLFQPKELIAYASQFFPLCEGDVIFTGTPAGVRPVHKNSVGVLALNSTESDYHFMVEWL